MAEHNRETGVLEPDVLLASQFFGALKRRVYPHGEHRLMIAILEDGVRCFMRDCGAKDPAKEVRFREAEEWIMSPDRSWFFSFENVCDTLGIDPDYLREGLVKWREARPECAHVETDPEAGPAEGREVG